MTKEDMERAEGILAEELKVEAFDVLENEVPEEFAFLPESIETKILEKSSSVNIGAETEKFNFQIKIKSATVAFKLKDVEDFAFLSLLSQTPIGKQIDRQSLKVEYSPETLNLELGKLIAQLNISAKIYPEIDLNSLKKGLSGKSSSEAEVLMENLPEISGSEIKLFPFWQRIIPKNLDKIKVELILEKR